MQIKSIESTRYVLIITRDIDINAFLEDKNDSSQAQKVQKNPIELISIPAISINTTIELVRRLLFNA